MDFHRKLSGRISTKYFKSTCFSYSNHVLVIEFINLLFVDEFLDGSIIKRCFLLPDFRERSR